MTFDSVIKIYKPFSELWMLLEDEGFVDKTANSVKVKAELEERVKIYSKKAEDDWKTLGSCGKFVYYMGCGPVNASIRKAQDAWQASVMLNSRLIRGPTLAHALK